MFRKTIYLQIILLVFAAGAAAQNSQVMYYMNLPQNHLLNPALRPTNSFYLGLPAISGVYVNVNNNFVNFSDIFLPGKRDSIISFLHPDYNIDEFLDKLKNRNFIAPTGSIPLLGLGFNAGKDLYISLDIIDHIDGIFVIPGDLVKLALKGNEDFLGETIDLSNLAAEFKYYREYGIGFSKSFGRNLRLGFKPKMLFGMAAFSLDNNSLGLTVNDDFSHSLDADITASFSGPWDFFYDDAGRPDSIGFDTDYFSSPVFFLNTSNFGFGLDVGATYKITDKINVSASITDFGFIKWKDQVTNLNAKSQFKFSGLNITDVVNGDLTLEELGEDMVDSLKNSFVFTSSDVPFTTFLPTGISLGGSLGITRSLSIGILSNSIIYKGQFREAATLSANLNLGNAFSTSFSYTAANNRYDNLGAGIAFRLSVVQLYFIADRIPVTWNRIITKDGNSVTIPSNWNTVNLRFGINLVMGNKVNKKNDKSMLPEQN